MSVVKNLATKQFWLSVALSIGTALLVCAVGALLVVWGLMRAEYAWVWVCFAWLTAAFLGGRHASNGQENTLLLSLSNGAISIGLLWLLGLTTKGEGGEQATLLWHWGAVLVGALLATLLPGKKRRRRKKKGR